MEDPVFQTAEGVRGGGEDIVHGAGRQQYGLVFEADRCEGRHLLHVCAQGLHGGAPLLRRGGGRIAEYLSLFLESTGVRVTIIEKDMNRSQELAEKLKQTDIICADGADTTILAQSGLSEADGFVALTNFDEDNIILSMYADKAGVEKVVSKVNNDKFITFLRDVFPDTTLSPKNLVAERIEGYVRGLAHASDKSTIEALYYLGNQTVTATEFVVGSKAACVGKTLTELKLKPGVLLAAVVRGGKSFTPDGKTVLNSGDKAIVITAGNSILDLDDILAR